MNLIYLKFDLEIDLKVKFDLVINVEIELLIENSGLRSLAASNRALWNFGRMLFREYALSCSRFSWIRTFVQTIFVAMYFGANQISWICTFVQCFSEIWNFGSMGFGIMRPYPVDIITPSAPFTDARTSLTNVPSIVHQCENAIDNQGPDILDNWIVCSSHLDIFQQCPVIDHRYLLFSV